MSSAELSRAYFDTTREVERINEYEAKAGAQARAVLRYFRMRPEQKISPSHCHEGLIALGLIDRRTPLTSIRRAITNLTDAEILRKSEEKVEGVFGRLEFCWFYEEPGGAEPKQLRIC